MVPKASIHSGTCAERRTTIFIAASAELLKMFEMRRLAGAARILVTALAMCAAACATSPAQDTPAARPNPAHSIARKISAPGVANFGEVTPTLYRGAQPTPEGFETLRKMGIAIVVDLRDGGEGKREEKQVTREGMKFVAIPWECSNPKDDYFAKFLAIVRDNPEKKVFVHCHVGVDRTGMMIAAYRMSEQGWTADEALREMRAFGFSTWHRMMCAGLSSYEQRFPSVVSVSPAFRNLRTAEQKPTPPPTPQP